MRYGYPEHVNVKMTLRKRQTLFYFPWRCSHFLSINTNNIYAFNIPVYSFVITFRNQYQYVVIHLPECTLLIFSAESSNFLLFLMEHNSTAGWFLLKSPSVAFVPLLKHANHLYINVKLYIIHSFPVYFTILSFSL